MLFIDPNQMPERKDGKIRRGARAMLCYVSAIIISNGVFTNRHLLFPFLQNRFLSGSSSFIEDKVFTGW